jgi:hypothetical protein
MVVSPIKNIHAPNDFMTDIFGFYAAAQRFALLAAGRRVDSLSPLEKLEA